MTKLIERPMSIEMFNFLNNIQIVGIGSFKEQGNVVDNTDTYISKMYTPNFKVSNATKNFLANLGVIGIIDTSLKLDTDSITYWLLTSNLKYRDSKVYNIFRLVIADIYTYTYAVEENRAFIKYLDKKDFTTTINNLNYVIDYLSGYVQEGSIIGELYNLSAALGVLKNQLSLIKEDANNG
jgi:hypothetical protein